MKKFLLGKMKVCGKTGPMTLYAMQSANSQFVKREKAKAKELRKTGWWKQKLAEGVCYYCENSFSVEVLTMDHIVPISRGGRSTKGNIVVACEDCNQKKKWKTPVEMIFDQEKAADFQASGPS